MTRPGKKLLFPPPPFEGEKETSKKDYSFECKLGDGAFGQVWRVRFKKNGKVFACKQVAKERVVKMIEQFRREVLIMYKINHPSIIKLFHHFEEVKSFNLVMELADGGNLFQKLVKEGKFEEKKAFCYFRQVLEAVEYLHSRKPIIIHRDIKPENIILDSDGNLKLTDFGWSNYYSGDQGFQRYTVCGTYEYLCPEMVRESGHTPSVDIWCLGILLYEMVSGHTPFKAPTKEALMENIFKGKIKFASHVSSPLRNLLLQILEKDPLKRISISSIKSHEWFSKFSALPLTSIKKPENSVIANHSLKSSHLASPASPQKTTSKQSEPSESIKNSFRISLVTLRQEIEARTEIVKILKTQIRAAIEIVLKEELKEDLLQQKIMQKRKNMLEVDENIRRLHEKIVDSNILQQRLIEIQQKVKLDSAISSSLSDLQAKEEKIQVMKEKLAKSKANLEELRYKFEDKARYVQNLRNYLNKLKNKGTVLHKNSQSQISELQISYECLKAKILESEQNLSVFESPENKSARDLMTFIKENKSKILHFLDFESKVKQIEDNLSLKEFELEKIKIEFLDCKKKIFRETWSKKEAIFLRQQRTENSKHLEIRESLEKCLEKTRETAKNFQLEKIEVLHATEKLKSLRAKTSLVLNKVLQLRFSHEEAKNFIENQKKHIENVEMELGLVKSSIISIEDLYL